MSFAERAEIRNTSVDRNENTITFEWTCPRCEHEQKVVVTGNEFRWGEFINCSNVAVCGRKNSYVYYQGLDELDEPKFGDAVYQDSMDAPLNAPAA